MYYNLSLLFLIIGLGTHSFVKISRNSDVSFESSCHLVLPV